MAMICPRCNGSFDQRWTCPACQVRLAYQAAPGRAASPLEVTPGGQWQQTPWGRIFFGVVIAQGLYYGLRQLVIAGLLASNDDAVRSAWSTLAGLLVLQGAQALGLVIAGVFTGAGQRQGIVYGAVLGVWNGVLSVVVQSAVGGATTVTLLGQPILHTAFGALGGFLGSLIWRPLPTLSLPSLAPPDEPHTPLSSRPRPSLITGPVAWPRVVAGSALAVGGTLWANVILDLLLDASDGKLAIDSKLQAELVTWEVTALAMLVGAAVAGACTSNSIKQGLVVGLAVSVVLIGLRFTTHITALHDMAITAISCFGLGVAGAWFGGSLFPPLARIKPRGLGPESA